MAGDVDEIFFPFAFVQSPGFPNPLRYHMVLDEYLDNSVSSRFTSTNGFEQFRDVRAHLGETVKSVLG